MNRKKTNSSLINAVIEIVEVEFWISKEAAKKIEEREDLILLRRYIDSEERWIPTAVIDKALKDPGIIDKMDYK